MRPLADRKSRVPWPTKCEILARPGIMESPPHYGIKWIALRRLMGARQFVTDCAPQGTVLRQNKLKALVPSKGLLSDPEKDYCPVLICYCTITAS